MKTNRFGSLHFAAALATTLAGGRGAASTPT
jgi:hypothetical protein